MSQFLPALGSTNIQPRLILEYSAKRFIAQSVDLLLQEARIFGTDCTGILSSEIALNNLVKKKKCHRRKRRKS